MFRKLTLLFLALVLVVVLIAPAAAQDDVVFGVVLVGPNDDRGWSTSHYEAGLYVEENLPGSTMLFFESLNPADSPETTLMEVVEFMVDEGSSVIFTTSDSFEEDTNGVAAAFPDVTFINITGSNAIAGSSVAEGDHAMMHELPELPSANVGNFNVYMELPRSDRRMCRGADQRERQHRLSGRADQSGDAPSGSVQLFGARVTARITTAMTCRRTTSASRLFGSASGSISRV